MNAIKTPEKAARKKTRRAGRKHRLRRLKKAYATSVDIESRLTKPETDTETENPSPMGENVTSNEEYQ